MKNLKTIMAVMLLVGFMVAGCSEQAKLETPPWSDEQIEQMEDEGVDSVPIAIRRF